jgi:hypothetical protein
MTTRRLSLSGKENNSGEGATEKDGRGPSLSRSPAVVNVHADHVRPLCSFTLRALSALLSAAIALTNTTTSNISNATPTASGQTGAGRAGGLFVVPQ